MPILQKPRGLREKYLPMHSWGQKNADTSGDQLSLFARDGEGSSAQRTGQSQENQTQMITVLTPKPQKEIARKENNKSS